MNSEPPSAPHHTPTHPDEEVDHEEDVEGEINLLCRVFAPLLALLNSGRRGVNEVDDE